MSRVLLVPRKSWEPQVLRKSSLVPTSLKSLGQLAQHM